MLSNLGFSELLLIFAAAFIIFGPTKLPEIGKAFGKTLYEFKQAAKDILNDK